MVEPDPRRSIRRGGDDGHVLRHDHLRPMAGREDQGGRRAQHRQRRRPLHQQRHRAAPPGPQERRHRWPGSTARSGCAASRTRRWQARWSSSRCGRSDGTIAYSNRKEPHRQDLPVTKAPGERARGARSARSSTTSTTRKTSSSASCAMPLLEIYAPVSGAWRPTASSRSWNSTRRPISCRRSCATHACRAGIVVALVTLAMLSVLFGIVRNGSQTIAAQQRALHDRIRTVDLLTQNESLHRRIDELSADPWRRTTCPAAHWLRTA